MAGQKFNLTFDATLNVSQMKGAVNEIQRSLNSLNLPQGIAKGLTGTLKKLSTEIQNFEVLSSKDITGKTDFSKIERSAEKINSLFSRLKIDLKDISSHTGKDLEKLFPETVSNNIQKANSALTKYIQSQQDLGEDIAKQKEKIVELTKSIERVSKKPIWSDEQKKSLSDTKKEITDTEKEIKQLYEKINDYNTKRIESGKNAIAPENYKKSSYLREYINDIEKAQKKLEELRNKRTELEQLQGRSITQKTQTKNLDELTQKLNDAQAALAKFEAEQAKLNSTSEGGGLNELIATIGKITGLDMSKFTQDVKGAGEAVKTYLNQELGKVQGNLGNLQNTVEGKVPIFKNLSEQIRQCGVELTNFDNRLQEVQQLKSRIQYFFGLNNTIQLIKRTMRDSYQTIKDLDKAMTETAVVTNFTVGNMWAQLPDYTKRANQLGVTTQAAYEAATLYYQQGLDTNEVTAMSNETLKMARIAGLDAAEATDRMTNAIRGFNMEINQMNAQRVDDVYSQLAAMSASNVDEISTAMTKVASLAHNANMDFETTAAFLAQIIETTRESAETAGTALKTVVARFSEVKKLVNEDQLKGTDEEGQVIDVNKVSQALRTAGIDLNKYFLGEVGLDDIFMELASKWDTLTSVQQRYIATQAAGSRQQSRFIALMQDYARMQELVGEAYNANGAAEKQFEKTQDSLESKLARLKNAWDQFAMGILNSDVIKFGVDLLTQLLNAVNALTSGFGTLTSGVGGFINTLAKLTLMRGALKLGKGLIAGTLGSGLSAITGGKAGGTFKSIFAQSIKSSLLGKFLNTGFGKTLTRGFLNPTNIIGSGIGQINPTNNRRINLSDKLGYLFKNKNEYLEANAEYQNALRIQKLWQDPNNPFAEGLNKYEIQQIQQDYNQRLLKATQKEQAIRAALGLKGYSPDEAREKVNNYEWDHNVKLNFFEKIGKKTAESKLFGGISKKIANANNGKVGAGLAKLFGFGDSAAAATAAAGLATTIAGVAAAAGVAYIAIKKMYEASPEGQLKKAEKYAEAISDIADNARKAVSEMRDVQQKTSDYETQIREATNSNDRVQAIQDQNEYILSLLEKNATYAQYIQSSFTSGGQLYLTIDSDALAAAVDKISEGAIRASAFNQFGQAIVAQQRAALYKSELINIDLNRNIRKEHVQGESGNPYDETQLTPEEIIRFRQYKNQVDAADLAMQQYTKIATGQLIDTFGLNIDNAEQELISSVIAANFNTDSLQKRADKIKGAIEDSAFLESEYLRLFGVELEKGYDEEQAKSSVALGKAIEESIGKEIPDLASIVTDSNSKLLLEVLAGSYEGAPQEIEAAIKGLTEEQKQIFADFLEVDSKDIQQTLQNRYQNLLKDQEAFRKESVNTLIKAGVTNTRLLDAAAKKLTVSQFKQLTDFANQWSDYGKEFNSILLEETTRGMFIGGEYGNAFEQFTTGITENPVLTLQALQQAAENTYPTIQNVAKSLLEINEPQFSQKNQLQYFLTSGEYENLNEEISKLIETNGEINSYNIEELANSSKTLSAMLDMDTMSANGLANAINALEAGNITILDLNEKVIELYESFDTTASAIERASYFIANFDPGKDYSEAINFVEDLAGKMQDFLDKGYLGNLEGYGKAMFANPPDPEDVEGWKNAITTLQQAAGNGGLDFWSNFVGFNVDESGFMDMDLAGFAESGITNYVDYIKSRAAENLPEGFNFSDAFYDLMLENARLHDAGAFEDIAAIELGKMMDAYGQATPTQADIQSIADAYGLEPQAILDAWTQRWEKEPLDFSQLQNKVREAYTGITDLADQAFSNAINNGASTSEAAYNRQNTSWILKQLGMGPDGNFSVDQLRLKIGQIVPEVADGSISVDDWLSQEIFKDGPVKLPVEFTTTKKVGDEWTTETYKAEVEVSNLEEYNAAVKQIQDSIQQQNIFENAEQYSSSLQKTIENISQIGATSLEASLTTAQDTANNIKASLENISSTVSFSGGGTITINGTSIPITVAAKGGIVSAANGTIKSGPALTGEEAPEIVWNKNKGYAYLTGKNGPEIQNLQPGDRVFDGKQTKDILKRSKIGSFAATLPNLQSKKDLIDSLGKGHLLGSTYWTTDKGKDDGGASNSSSKKSEDWKKDLDWLYNLMEDIAELERIQSTLSEKHDQYLEDIAKTGRDLYNLTNEQLNNLYTQRDNYQEALTRRLQEMREQITDNKLSNYVWWNNEDQTIEIDWDAINKITDKDQYDKVTDLISKAEKIQDEIDDAQDALLDINGQIAELEKRYLQEYIDLQKRVYDAVVNSYQQQIDQLTSLNETLDDSNSQILSSLQKEIELQRQIRDNTDTENSIKELEARLAFLRRDTSGANELEIKELEQQLKDARQDYTDKLIDQAIEKLEESNSEASEQRQKQIDLLTEQLDYWKEVGALWPEVAKLLDEGINGDGSLIRGSNLEKILQNAEEWKGMSQEQRDVWANELILSVNQAGAYIIKMAEGFDNLSEGIWALIPESSKPFATGGLATKTGPAWLDGTVNEPEYVLNARQTEAFLKLADILPAIFGNTNSTTNNFGGNVYVELNMSVGEIGSDYDVDRLVERVKEDIYSASSYRNVNAVNFLR